MAGRPKGQGRGKPVLIETTAAGSRTMAGVGEATTMLAGPDNIRAWRELLRDPQVAGVWQQRQLALLATEWEVEAGGDGAPEERAAAFLREQLDRVGFDRAFQKMHHGQFYGFSVAECMWAKDGDLTVLADIRVRAPERFRFKGGGLRFMGGDDPEGTPLPDNKMWVYRTPGDSDDVPHGPALGWRLYWPVFLKKNGGRFWAVALEKFGMPTAKGVYPPGTSETEARRLLESLLAVHGRAAVAFPEGFQVELLQSMKTVGDDYRAFQDYWDRAVSKILLSQTMTTDDGSSKSQALVHEEVRDAVVQADADLLCESFNQGPAVWLTEWNFPGAVPPRVWRHIRRREDLSGRALRDRHLAEASGLRPTKSYIEDVYGGEWEPAAKRASAPPAASADFAEAGDDDLTDLAGQLDALAAPALSEAIDRIKGVLGDSATIEEARHKLLALVAAIDDEALAETVEGALSVAALRGAAEA